MDEKTTNTEYGTTGSRGQDSAHDMDWLNSDAPWTTDAAVNEFLQDLELPPEPVLKQYMQERAVLEAAAPKPGEPAPDFRLEKLAASGARSGKFVSLADYRGRPLALVFGNFTCPIYRGQLEQFIAAYAEHGERIAFLKIYVKEEHPEDGWQLGINRDQCVVYNQPQDADARADIAGDLIARFQLPMPVVLDDMQNSVCTAYHAAPERLYILDSAGVVLHRSPPGPFHMDAVDAWRAALRRLDSR